MDMLKWIPPKFICPAPEIQDLLIQRRTESLSWQSPSGHIRDTSAPDGANRTLSLCCPPDALSVTVL